MFDDRDSSMRKEATMTSLWLSLLFASSIVSIASGESAMETMRRTLPAYAIAVNAETTLNSSSCSRELGVFRDAVEVRKLWALKGQYEVSFHFRFILFFSLFIFLNLTIEGFSRGR